GCPTRTDSGSPRCSSANSPNWPKRVAGRTCTGARTRVGSSMARDHGRILCRIWSDKDFRALPRTAQALYMQLLSQKEINNAGVLPLMLSKWAKGCDEIETSEDLVPDLAALIAARFIVVDSDTEEVLVRSFIRNDGVLKQP